MRSGTFGAVLIAALVFAGGAAQAQSQRRAVEFDGRLQLDHDHFDGLYSNSGRDRSATYLRRARLGATWRPARDWRLGAELDADGDGKVTLRTAAVEWTGLRDTTLTFGRFDPDFGLEQAISSKWTTGIERSAAWDLLPDVAESLEGLGLQLAHAGQRHYASAGVFDKPQARSLLARAVFAPWASSGRVLHLGLSLAAERIEAGGDGRVRSRLGVRGVGEHDDGNRVTLADALDTADDNPFDRERSRALEFAFASGPYSVQAEALRRELSGRGGNRVASGQYLQLAWTVTGQARPYDIDGARFEAIEPAAGSGGAWELFYRLDRLAVRGAGASRTRARVHALGLNWYATPSVRLAVNWLAAKGDGIVNDAGDDSGRSLGLRLQVVFLMRAAVAGLLLSCALSAPAQTMTVLDQVEIAASPAGGVRPDELSGLAWDVDEQMLYAVSDRGRVFAFRLRLDGTSIRELTAVHGAPLTAADGAPARFNAEGLTLLDADNGRTGDTQLLVTIENGQRLLRFTPQGRALGEIALPPALADADNYRGGNNGLEAVTVHPRHGRLLAPQRGLRGTPAHLHTLYAADGATWSFERAPGGEVKAIEALADGALLVLERPGSGGARLRRVDLDACAGADKPCAVKDLLDPAALDAADNHEGLARLSDQLFVIVSDNGKGKGQARPTRLVLLGLR